MTKPGMITTPAGKQVLSRQSGVVAMDMESYWVARAASDRGLPFLAMRAISDAQGDLLPSLDHILDAEGNLEARPLAVYLIREPGSLVTLVKLAQNARRARRALTMGVACTVAAL